MNHYFDLTVPQFSKMLKNLDHWMKAAASHAEVKKFPVDNFLTLRLAPDQFAFARQVQVACDNAKGIAARLAGKEVPTHADTETTMEGLHTRIAAVLSFLETFKPDDFAGAAERKITLPWMQGKWFKGEDYLVQYGIPNFHFHITHAYAILRHAGVTLGKQDYLGNIPTFGP